jgi:hypothetical protein
MRPQDFLENANGDVVTAVAKWLCHSKCVSSNYSEEQKQLHLLSIMADPCNDFRPQAHCVLAEMKLLLSEHESAIRQSDFVLSKKDLLVALVSETNA